MMDINAAGLAAPPQPIHREDYRPPDWLVPSIELDFSLDAAETIVRARLHVVRNGDHDRPLWLDRDGPAPRAVRIDGEGAGGNRFRFDDDAVVVPLSGREHIVETEVAIAPEANSQLMGLYASGGLLCTQCEAEGFRRITPFPDRPDILTRYRVRMEADRACFPVLLSNGDLIEEGVLSGNRQFAVWDDPYPKPSYLFALVAGDLAANRETFTTMSGREVTLGIWVREADLARTQHAMAALKAAMAWDERAYGREYDLAVFNIVAVADFNFGAMENKGLNIFNSRYVLADPETATDADYDAIAAIVAHEYFHNWSGNRVTCRDWFQLSLKEGFTVFRDQQFTADRGSPAVARIEQVRNLRAAQFPEDSGPLAHPVRPESYQEISNFYTATVYNKGAEVIRMMRAMLGAEAFRRGSDLYFARHDGTAATCEDFVAAMEEASGVDLEQFRLWYSQAGTPHVTARLAEPDRSGRAVLTLSQEVPSTPGQPHKAPMTIPLQTALFAPDGTIAAERQLVLTEAEQAFGFEQVPPGAILSINRDFSAPVIVEPRQSADALAFLSANESDSFARYEAMQQLMLAAILAGMEGDGAVTGHVVRAVSALLADAADDSAFVAETVLLPSEAFVGERLDVIDPDAVHAARERVRRALAVELQLAWESALLGGAGAPYRYDPIAKGERRMRGVALAYLALADPAKGMTLARARYDAADDMTDRQSALAVLANGEGADREAALADFYARYADDSLIVDKWFSVQALSTRDDTAAAVEGLLGHADFALGNPNRVRALVGAFTANPRAFHAADGRGYRLLGRTIADLDALNPQTAAKLVPPLGRWRRYDAERGAMMRGELERILNRPAVSRDVAEQASKSLA